MYEWICNGFVLKQIFGEEDILQKCTVDNLIWNYASHRCDVSLRIIPEKPVFIKKYGELDEIYIRITLDCICNVVIDMSQNTSKVNRFENYLDTDGNKHIIEFYSDGKLFFKCRFFSAILDNIKPYNYEQWLESHRI